MRTKPTAQQRPKALHRIHMHFTKAVAIFIAGEFTPPMVDALMIVAPSTQASINTVFIRVYQCTYINGVLFNVNKASAVMNVFSLLHIHPQRQGIREHSSFPG